MINQDEQFDDDTEFKSDSKFIVSFCNEGVEGVVPLSELENENILSILKGGKQINNVSEIVNQIILRAKFNPQRFYEVYVFTASAGITADDIREMFNNEPQYAADLIRKIGNRLYGERQNPSKVVIR